MIKNISELGEIPTVIILYYAGSSGEMLGHLLTQTLDDVSKTNAVHWENGNRCKFLDFYDRALTSGWETISDQLVIDGVNRYLSTVTCKKKYQVGLAHPKKASIEFLQSHAAHCPVIEICNTTSISLEFRHMAALHKIRKPAPVYHRPGHEFSSTYHLKLEWSDLFLNDAAGSFNKISEFLKTAGDLVLFKTQIDRYLGRNADILNAIS